MIRHERSPLDALAFIALHPEQIADIGRWARDRRKSPIDARRPWWTYGAVQFLEKALPDRPQVFEYGAGGSTLWLLDRGSRVDSVEHDAGWHAALGLPQVRLVPPAVDGDVFSVGEPGALKFFDQYVEAIDAYVDECFDLVVVDGRCRVECALRARPKLKHGGLLLFDDFHRHRYTGFMAAVPGWDVRHFDGLRPHTPRLMRTTIMRRP